MANVLQPHIDFHPRPVAHSPSPFGFGFALTGSSSSLAPTAWPSASATTLANNHAALQPLVSSGNYSPSQIRVQKRRLDGDDDVDGRSEGPRDASMDRSPTPERPKRAAPKRARVSPTSEVGHKGSSLKENKTPNDHDDSDDVDVGMLLASLPPQSLLPLLNSLLTAQPSLKSLILPLIPRPTLDTAIHALGQAAKQLRDAYPYSSVSSTNPQGFTPNFGFGRSTPTTHNDFGHSQAGTSQNGGMRDSYILSRLRPHIMEFVATCNSYLPYFSYLPLSSEPHTASNDGRTPSSQPHSQRLQSIHKDKSHPSETFLFLSTVTNHFLSQPSLTQTSLAPLLLPRLSDEWKAWVDRVDSLVNNEGRMFGSETVGSWERGLDELANAKLFEGAEMMRMVRDRWVGKVGWLVGRMGYPNT